MGRQRMCPGVNRRVAAALGGVFALVVGFFTLMAVMLSTVISNAPQDVPTAGCGGGVAPAVAVGTGGGVNVAARAVLAAGWTGAEAVTMTAIAGPESTFNPLAENKTTSARGMFQIMMSLHRAKFHGADWRDPAANARVARILYNERRSDGSIRGFTPWVGYTSGKYKKYLPAAFTAVGKASGLSSGPTVTGAAVTNNGGTLRPAAQQAAAVVRSRFGFTGTIYGFDDRNIAGSDQLSMHALGLAIDVMLPLGARSDAVADFFAGPAYGELGVVNVIHNHRIYNRGRGWHPYTGANPHTDHVHIDFHDTGAVADAGTLADPAVACTAPVAQPVATGAVVYPVAGAVDQHNYGNGGSHWAHGHTGTDLSVGCGTPVHAATRGTVIVDTTQGWAGRWLVKVATGPRRLTTWYAHMQALSVMPGQAVVAGQVLGEVGQLGNATGCHLHFEVHPHGGGIYEDGVNPSTWLAGQARSQTRSGT